VGSTVCPGYVFFDDIEFNGGPHQVNFLKADCGYSVQMVSGWAFGAASGDGFVFNKHTAPATAGSNVVLISNSELLGQPTGRGMFVNWNNFTMTGSFLAGSAGNVFEVGDNAFVTTLSGGTIGGGGLSTGYCVASQAGTPTRSLFITGTVVTSGCTLGNFNDPGAAMILDLPAGYPPLKPMTGISGCGAGCTVTIFNGNQDSGSLLITTGTGPAAAGQFTMNFTVPLTPYPLCLLTPRAGALGVWDSRASVFNNPTMGGATTTVIWANNAANLAASTGYFIDFKCSAL
jgi:hypothetical protein